MTSTAPTRPSSPLYLELWKAAPRELAYLLVSFPLAIVAFTMAITLVPASIGTVVLMFLGVFAFLGALYVARGFGTLDLILLEWTGRPRIERPQWSDENARPGFFPWLARVFGNGHYWLYLVHSLFIVLAISTLTWTILVAWLSLGLGGVTYWLWDLLDRADSITLSLGDAFWALDNPFINAGIGVVLLATLPFVTRGLTLLHWVVARWLLGAHTPRPTDTVTTHVDAAPSAEALAA